MEKIIEIFDEQTAFAERFKQYIARVKLLSFAYNSNTKQLKKYWYVKIGMTEAEMLSIIGNGFNRSLLKDNRTVYEWRTNATSYGSYQDGFSIRNYSGIKKVTICTKNGFVEQIKAHNID